MRGSLLQSRATVSLDDVTTCAQTWRTRRRPRVRAESQSGLARGTMKPMSPFVDIRGPGLLSVETDCYRFGGYGRIERQYLACG